MKNGIYRQQKHWWDDYQILPPIYRRISLCFYLVIKLLLQFNDPQRATYGDLHPGDKTPTHMQHWYIYIYKKIDGYRKDIGLDIDIEWYRSICLMYAGHVLPCNTMERNGMEWTVCTVHKYIYIVNCITSCPPKNIAIARKAASSFPTRARRVTIHNHHKHLNLLMAASQLRLTRGKTLLQ